jgi:hypothetical protein
MVPGVVHKTAHTGAVTLTYWFGSALNLNIHFHIRTLTAPMGWHGPVPLGQSAELSVNHTIGAQHRPPCRPFFSNGKGYERDAENAYLSG